MTVDRSNRLAQETSPYLLEHADNPVDWYPWCDEAFDRAVAEHKPVLLSIGYSACHWCHVMARECFEDPDIAELMNDNFVNIKVDREERPDLDRIYQTAHQVLTQRPGGWPLTMFLTPDDRVPFFGGTYFPPEPRPGLPAFPELLKRIAQYYSEHEQELRDQNARLVNVFRQLEQAGAHQPDELDGTPLGSAREKMHELFDERSGGFGSAPKFPHPTSLQGLMRRWHRAAREGEPDRQALYMVTHTLRRMAEGGVYDQIGGGFCRYSVDESWTIPHFEKMLYDNGPLAALYAQAYAATGEQLFADVARETCEWVLRDMRSTNGAFFATLDADSEGEEGRFYLWTPEELLELLPEDQARVVAARYGLDGAPNFEGRWHPCVRRGMEATARQADVAPEQADELLAEGRRRLLEARNQRVWPRRDEKILAAWNGLMIRGLAVTARHLERDDFAEAATRAVDFLRETLWRDGRLLAVYKDGRAHTPAYLEDHANLMDGLVTLLEVRWRRADLDFALQLAEVLLDHFEDTEHGGFFLTADDHETLIHRPKPLTDESMPAGNGIAAQAFLRLGYLIGEPRYLETAERTLKGAWQHIQHVPHAHYSLLIALEDLLFPPATVLLRGREPELSRWHAEVVRGYAPDRQHSAIPDDESGLPGALAERSARDDADVTAYVCEGMTCKAPVTELDALRRELGLS